MADDNPTIYQAVEQFLEDRRRNGLTPPRAEELIEYVQGDLSETETTALLQRLALDRATIDTLLELEKLPEDQALQDHPALSEAADRTAWKEMLRRTKESLKGSDVGSRPPVGPKAWWGPTLAPLILSAACVGLGIYGFILRSRLAELYQPSLASPVIEVFFGRRESGQAPETLRDRLTLRFGLPPGDQRFFRFRVEIERMSNNQIIFAEDLEKNAASTVDLLLSRQYFAKPGEYSAVVYGLRDGTRERLGSRIFLVAP